MKLIKGPLSLPGGDDCRGFIIDNFTDDTLVMNTYNKKYYNIPLHGACYIFSQKFIKERKKAFFEGTFMYFESEILDYECQSKGYKTMYDPSVIVNHHHSISSQKSRSSELKRERFVNKCVENSISSFLTSIDKES